MNVAQEAAVLLGLMGVPEERYSQGDVLVRSPISGEVIGRVAAVDTGAAGAAIERAHAAFLEWRTVPPPRRGELVRLLAEELRAQKSAL